MRNTFRTGALRGEMMEQRSRDRHWPWWAPHSYWWSGAATARPPLW